MKLSAVDTCSDFWFRRTRDQDYRQHNGKHGGPNNSTWKDGPCLQWLVEAIQVNRLQTWPRGLLNVNGQKYTVPTERKTIPQHRDMIINIIDSPILMKRFDAQTNTNITKRTKRLRSRSTANMFVATMFFANCVTKLNLLMGQWHGIRVHANCSQFTITLQPLRIEERPCCKVSYLLPHSLHS